MATGRPQLKGHKVKPKRPQIKHECGCGRFVYMPANQARLSAEHGGDTCSRCAGRYLPASLEDCAEYAPALIHLHGDYAEDARVAHLDDWADCEGHCECGWRMPPGADPDYFYCRKCGKVNERQLDGTMGSFSASPFSPEAEKANGLTVKYASAAAVRRLAEPDTYAVNPDVPF